VSAQDSNAEIFDVFLCHNSEDKPAVREISRKLAENKIKPWLDEEQIRPGTSWQTTLGQAAINDFIDGSEPSGIVVCCRLMEYQWLPERLKLNAAICLESLSSEEVSKYLVRGGSKLAALREAVETDPALQELT
jgi:TIR domain